MIARIWSMGVWRSASPRLRRGPMAASLAKAVMSEPEKPVKSEVVRNKDEIKVGERRIYPR